MIKESAIDERNYVKKSVSLALRNIGKRNKSLNSESIKLAKTVEKIDLKSACWIVKDVLKELVEKRKQI